MLGALYFPMISVPESAWLTRTLLYWDTVGTIVPDSFVDDPDLLDPYTRALVRSDLLLQVFPSWAEGSVLEQFVAYVESLPQGVLRVRQRAFARGRTVMIHGDKWLVYGPALRSVRELGLATRTVERGWVAVEETTGGEFMAALALALCHPRSRPQWYDRRRDRFIQREAIWTPVTDSQRSLEAIFAGLRKIEPEDLEEDEMVHRLRAEEEVSAIRTSVLNRLLPVPMAPVAAEQLSRFRRRHGRRLPQFRERMEGLVERVVREADPNRRRRMIDAAQHEADQSLEQIEAYMAEAGMRRVARSSLIKVLRFAPAASGPARTAQDLAESLLVQPNFDTNALAYLAFAEVELEPMSYVPSTPLPLADAMMMPL